MKDTKHEALVASLNKNFGYRLKVQKENYGAQLDIDINDIREAVELFTDALNIKSGSVGSRDLYTLMSKYLTDKKFQESVRDL